MNSHMQKVIFSIFEIFLQFTILSFDLHEIVTVTCSLPILAFIITFLNFN